MLPTRATVEDVQNILGYLAKKPTGATLKEAKAVLKPSTLDTRKLSALKEWNLIEHQEKLKITEKGRRAVRNEGKEQADVFWEILNETAPYTAIVERIQHRREQQLTAVDVAAHWNEFYGGESSDNEETLNAQAVCFFQVAAGAGLGHLVVGRRGSPTRFEFDLAEIDRRSQDADDTPNSTEPGTSDQLEDDEIDDTVLIDQQRTGASVTGQGIFIAHGKNTTPVKQLEKILSQFKIPYKVAVDEPNLGRPISGKVKETMQACNCAILIFTADEKFLDSTGATVWRPSENVIYELGAASFLYENKVVILKEETVQFPSNYRDIGYISFEKDQLESKSLDVIKELIGFGIVKIST